MQDEVVGGLNQQTRPPSQAKVKVEVRKLRNPFKERAANTALPSRNILAEEIAMVSATGSANLPRLGHLKRTIRMQRKDNDHPPNPINRAAIPVIPLCCQQKAINTIITIINTNLKYLVVFF